MHFVKISLRWSISLLSTRYILYHLKEHSEIDRTEWHKLLGSFSKVTILDIGDGLVKELSRSLRLDDGEHPLELLPELQELTYSGSGNSGDAFTSFIGARQTTGRPVTLVCPTQNL